VAGGQERPGARWFRRIAGTDIDHAVAFFSEGYDLRSPVVRRTSRHTPWDFSGVGDERMSLCRRLPWREPHRRRVPRDLAAVRLDLVLPPW
jgi:hypothetical protein